jgi:putative transposase
MEAAEELASSVGTLQACLGLSVPRATLYRRRARLWTPQEPRARPSPARSLARQEKEAVLEILHSERFCDSSPASVYATLLDEGIYVCSASTMYRVLAEAGEVRERRRVHSHKGYARPELMAQRPNEVWSWDITKLKGPVKWNYFYLYVILDIFSRFVVGWMVAHREAATLAERLIAETTLRHDIMPNQLTVHADRGPSMRSKTVALLLTDLGITKTHTRPYTASDNPYSEAHFKTLKYRPEFPGRFDVIDDARLFCQGFFSWYNHDHRHSGIGYMTPDTVHYGKAEEVSRSRQFTLLDAFAAHPERFVRKVPQPPEVPTVVWINKPTDDEQREEARP